MSVMRGEKQLFESIFCKFIVNLPRQQMEDMNRLSYHAEKAFYYYVDQILRDSDSIKDRKQNQKNCNQFLYKLKTYSPSYLKIDPIKIFNKLLENKPTCGAIVFNKQKTKVLVIKVRGKFGFPKGKWNQHQTAMQCAARQVQQETGIYIHGKIDPLIKFAFDSHGAICVFFVARQVSQDQRIKRDKKQIDDIFWMWVEDIRTNLNRFVEKSKEAWKRYEQYESSQKTSKVMLIQAFMQKYGPQESDRQQSKAEEIKENPLLNFKFDTKKLQMCLDQLDYR